MKKISNLGLVFLIILFVGCSKEDNINDAAKTTLSKIPAVETGIHLCTEMDLLNNKNKETSKANGAIITAIKWDAGQTIRIKFLNGDSFLQEKVKQFANEWMSYANLSFEYVLPNEDADVKIAFKWNGDVGSWSYFR